jgi:hypothetical protein
MIRSWLWHNSMLCASIYVFWTHTKYTVHMSVFDMDQLLMVLLCKCCENRGSGTLMEVVCTSYLDRSVRVRGATLGRFSSECNILRSLSSSSMYRLSPLMTFAWLRQVHILCYVGTLMSMDKLLWAITTWHGIHFGKLSTCIDLGALHFS